MTARNTKPVPTQAQAPSEAQAAQAYPSLEYDVKIHSLRPEGTCKGTASVNLNGQFAVRGVKVMEGVKGLFVSMPSYRAGNGEYRDICFPCTKESRVEFDAAVLDAYRQALTQAQAAGQDRAQAPDPTAGQAQGAGPGMTM